MVTVTVTTKSKAEQGQQRQRQNEKVATTKVLKCVLPESIRRIPSTPSEPYKLRIRDGAIIIVLLSDSNISVLFSLFYCCCCCCWSTAQTTAGLVTTRSVPACSATPSNDHLACYEAALRTMHLVGSQLPVLPEKSPPSKTCNSATWFTLTTRPSPINADPDFPTTPNSNPLGSESTY
jgi:hypothetical protein